MKRWTIALGAALVLCVGGAEAQISASGGPIDISANTLEVNDQARQATYRGEVEVLQGGNRMRADQLAIFYSASGGPQTGTGRDYSGIERMEASGNVYFVTAEQTARGDRAVYTTATDTIVITGNVVIAQGENVMRGDRVTIHVRENRSTMEGSGGRVRGVFYPDKKS
jgi:lipopolysaccharide export system protein LptA